MDELLTQWIEAADVETTDVYDEITYENVEDYLPEAVKSLRAAANTSTEDESAADEQTTSDNESATEEQTDAQSATDEAQTATTESAQ